jgi:hypothetical protein
MLYLGAGIRSALQDASDHASVCCTKNTGTRRSYCMCYNVIAAPTDAVVCWVLTGADIG